MVLRSNYSEKELAERWDSRLNPARFAGNDDVMDLVFYGVRKGNRIKLMRRSGIGRVQFSAVFRGVIASDGKGSYIKGFFSKSIADYIFTSLGLGFVFFIYETVKRREDVMGNINIIILIALAAAFFLLYIRKGIKKQYIDLLREII